MLNVVFWVETDVNNVPFCIWILFCSQENGKNGSPNYTVTIERNRVFQGEFTTEPYECGWASEAIFFIRKLETTGRTLGAKLRVQISADGIRWCDEGTILRLTSTEVDLSGQAFREFPAVGGEIAQGWVAARDRLTFDQRVIPYEDADAS